jgi:uncharacterized protein YecT (DUF1311 family)
MLKLGIGVVFAVMLPCVALAQEETCGDLNTQTEMTACSERAWQAADEDLNAAYGAARARMKEIDAGNGDTAADKALRDAQRAWVSFRDLACASEGAPYRGGSIEPMIIYGCFERLTLARSADLSAMAEEY